MKGTDVACVESICDHKSEGGSWKDHHFHQSGYVPGLQVAKFCLSTSIHSLTLAVASEPLRNLRKYTIYDLLVQQNDELTIFDVIVPTQRRELVVAPCTVDLAAAEVELVGALARENRLRHVLEPIRRRCDYILIDCPPSFGLLTLNALVAADALIIPIQCEYLALEGLSHLLNTVQIVKNKLNPELYIEGVVLTMFDPRTRLAGEIVREVRNHFPKEAFQTIINRNVRLSEAPSYGQSILDYDPSSPGPRLIAH